MRVLTATPNPVAEPVPPSESGVWGHHDPYSQELVLVYRGPFFLKERHKGSTHPHLLIGAGRLEIIYADVDSRQEAQHIFDQARRNITQ